MRTIRVVKEGIAYPMFIYLVACIVDTLSAGKSN